MDDRAIDAELARAGRLVGRHSDVAGCIRGPTVSRCHRNAHAARAPAPIRRCPGSTRDGQRWECAECAASTSSSRPPDKGRPASRASSMALSGTPVGSRGFRGRLRLALLPGGRRGQPCSLRKQRQSRRRRPTHRLWSCWASWHRRRLGRGSHTRRRDARTGTHLAPARCSSVKSASKVAAMATTSLVLVVRM